MIKKTAIQKELDKQRKPEERKYKGRKAVRIANFDKHYERYMKREVTKVALARKLGISRPTLDKLINAEKLK